MPDSLGGHELRSAPVEPLSVILGEAFAVTDGDDGGALQLFGEEPVKPVLVGLGQRGGSLVKKKPVGAAEQRARKRQALLLPAGKDLRPVLASFELAGEPPQPDAPKKTSESRTYMVFFRGTPMGKELLRVMLGVV